MSFDELIGISSRIFFHPFKTFSDIKELFQNQPKNKVIQYSLLGSLMGNMTFILVAMAMSDIKIWGSIGYFIFHCLLYLIWIYIIDFFILGLFYLLISMAKDSVIEFEKLFGLYFMSYFVYIILLPLALLLKIVLPSPETVYSIIIFGFGILVFILKLKAAVITCTISFGKAIGLYILPIIIIIFMIIISMGYFISFFFKLLA